MKKCRIGVRVPSEADQLAFPMMLRVQASTSRFMVSPVKLLRNICVPVAILSVVIE